MNIRLMTEKDLPQVISLQHQLFKQQFNFEDYVQDKMFHYGIVIEETDQVVGYLVGQIIFEMSDLYYVAVHPNYRSRGYGKLLVDQFIHDAYKNDGDTMSLEVRMSNQAAISLYEKCGFISVGTRARYYADGEDALLMTRNFK
ncbi:MAG: ribosomal protein S18-alanine N-acetyltransferase [Turicibacter sp.]|nr:ribosomal protein S18-alanine N-acetyltransferase [Turicibacter sp.]